MVLIILTFTGCEKSSEIKPQNIFKSAFTLNYNSLQICGDISVSENNQIDITVNRPDKLKGLKVKVLNQKATVSFKGITTELDEKQLPEGAFFELLNTALKQIVSSETAVYQKHENEYQAEIDTGLGKMKVILNDEFFIKSISIDSQGFTVKFNDME